MATRWCLSLDGVSLALLMPQQTCTEQVDVSGNKLGSKGAVALASLLSGQDCPLKMVRGWRREGVSCCSLGKVTQSPNAVSSDLFSLHKACWS